MRFPHFTRHQPATPADSAQPSERGDTLIEVLVAIAVIAIALVALLGSLMESTGASVTHRNMANLDSILRSFAESARYQIQTQPADGSIGPLFRPCATSYPLASDPYPNSAPSGTWITVFVTGFAPNSNLSVTVGTTSVSIVSGTQTDGAGNQTVIFTAPSAIGQQPVTVSDTAGDSATPKVPFTVAPSGSVITSSTYSNYTITSSVAAYPTGTCTNQQQITLKLFDSQSGHAAADQLPFVVGNFGPAPVTVAVSSTAQTVPSTLTFAASVTNAAGAPVTSGTLTWSFASGTPGNPTCPTSTLPANTCTVNITNYSNSGNYSVFATYHAASGQAYPDGYVGQTTAILDQAQPAITLSQTATSGPLAFNASVGGGGPTPNGSMAWTISGTDGSNGTCATQTGPTGASSPVTYTCMSNVTSPVTGVTYTATANYGNDTVYDKAVKDLAVTVPMVTVAGTQASHKLTFTATVAASRTDTASLTSGSATVTDTSITASDTGTPVVGAGIPPGTYVGAVTPGVSFLLSSSPSTQTNVNATANGTSVTLSEPGSAATPTGSLKWTIAVSTGTAPTCLPSTLDTSGTASCTFSGTAGTTYTATAQYQGDQATYIYTYASGVSAGVTST
jgi:prepilin-type N-terminal cleavage/methylation domain-containing protein